MRPITEIVQELLQEKNREENFQLLFRHYYGKLYRFFQKKRMPLEDCRDLTQEVFIAVYKGLKDLRQEDQFERWLNKVIMNVYRSEIERRQAQKRAAHPVSLEERPADLEDLPPTALQIADQGDNPMEALIENEKREQLRAALQELSGQMRCCMQLRVVKDFSYGEIAEIMGISINTVKAHLHQARKVLKAKLGQNIFDEVDV